MKKEKEVEIRTVNIHGQVCIGKDFAKKQVQIVKQDNGDIIIKKGHFIPESERWLYRDNNLEKLMEAVEESKKTSARADNFEEIMKKLEDSIND